MPQYPLPLGLVQLSSLEVSAEQRQTLEEGGTSAESEAAEVRADLRPLPEGYDSYSTASGPLVLRVAN